MTGTTMIGAARRMARRLSPLAAAAVIATVPSALQAQQAGPRAPEGALTFAVRAQAPGDTTRFSAVCRPGALTLSGKTSSARPDLTNLERMMTDAGGTARLFDELFGENSREPLVGEPGDDRPAGEDVASPPGGAGDQQADGARYDVWGAKRNPGFAIAEVAGVNALVWFFNEYPRGANFTSVSPRSWWFNISHGFFWDDNHFKTMRQHPFAGGDKPRPYEPSGTLDGQRI